MKNWLHLADLEKNPSEHEAISASLKVQKLLAEYHLTLAQVMGEEDVKEDVEQAIADCGKGSSNHNWRFILAGCVASGYCCKSYRVGREKKDCSAGFLWVQGRCVISKKNLHISL